MHTLSRQAIEQLQSFTHAPGLMLSCYVNLKVQEASERPGILEIRHAASLVKQSIPEISPERKEFEQNLNKILKSLEEPDLLSHPALAIFAARQRGQFVTIPLGLPVRSELIYSETPYLVPLLQCYFAQQREYLALVFDNEQAHLYLGHGGGVKLLKHWHSEVPSKQHSSGERGGWSQPNIASRREEMLARHQKEMIEGLSKALLEHPPAHIFLFGHEVEVTQLKNHLPAHLGDRVVHTSVSHHLDSEKLLTKGILEHVRRQNVLHAQSLLDELKKGETLPAGCACGAKAVLSALDAGRMTQKGSLLLGPDPKEDALLCTSCRHLSLDEVTQCPRCGSRCQSCNLWEELLLRAFRHGWNVIPLDGTEPVAKAGFIAMFMDAKA